MGKKLIIIGADFSGDSVPQEQVTSTYGFSDCTMEGGIVYNTGAVSTASAGWTHSVFIAVTADDTLVLSATGTAASFGLAFYSSNNESSYISGVKYAEQSSVELTIPSNASYVRISGSSTNKPTLVHTYYE